MVETLETDREKALAELFSELEMCRTSVERLLSMEVAIRKGILTMVRLPEDYQKYKEDTEKFVKEHNCECIMKVKKD